MCLKILRPVLHNSLSEKQLLRGTRLPFPNSAFTNESIWEKCSQIDAPFASIVGRPSILPIKAADYCSWNWCQGWTIPSQGLQTTQLTRNFGHFSIVLDAGLESMSCEIHPIPLRPQYVLSEQPVRLHRNLLVGPRQSAEGKEGQAKEVSAARRMGKHFPTWQ